METLEPTQPASKMIPTEHLEYSPEDLLRYLAMLEEQRQLLAQDKTLFDAPELWCRFENLRNKYNGNPPIQLINLRAKVR
jgi:hypothetical protein